LEPSLPPAISIARFAITSLTFMLLWLPEPVCQTIKGKWSASLPPMISWAAWMITSLRSSSSSPSSWFASAAAFFRIPNARMISGGMRSVPIRKFTNERAVWAP
jgi:hypothetical protein